MEAIEFRMQEVQARIKESCARVNRDPKSVNCIAVTKYLSIEQTKHAIDVGMNHLGESRMQDAIPKVEGLHPDVVWHFIGSLQRKKAKDLVGRFGYVHSVDGYPLAMELNKQFEKNKRTLKCFIQVNISGEKSKHGIFPHELQEFLSEVNALSFLDVIGLMTMAPRVEQPEEVRCVFRELKRLQQVSQSQYSSISHLSMGMSQDYEIAIEEGATWIRLGSVLFDSQRH